jgi:hypothetical protein
VRSRPAGVRAPARVTTFEIFLIWSSAAPALAALGLITAALAGLARYGLTISARDRQSS